MLPGTLLRHPTSCHVCKDRCVVSFSLVSFFSLNFCLFFCFFFFLFFVFFLPLSLPLLLLPPPAPRLAAADATCYAYQSYHADPSGLRSARVFPAMLKLLEGSAVSPSSPCPSAWPCAGKELRRLSSTGRGFASKPFGESIFQWALN